VTLGDLGRTLGERGQMLALDPPGAERLSVAEAFASAVAGPRAHGYGMPRDLLLGVALCLPDGSLVHGGGRVVKNVAGYDLPRLVVGSAGRLGQIERACVRLHPLPAATCTVVAEPADPLVLEPLAPACVIGEVVEDDEAIWAEHRDAALGLHVHRALPAAVPAAIDELRESGATRIVGRLARGILYTDVQKRCQAPFLQPLEQRVVEAFGG